MALTYISNLSRLFNQAYLLFIVIISCVGVEPPEGGPPDETPPVLVRSFPENGALQFKSKKIQFSFNKAITVENIYSNLVIMPKLDVPKNKQPYSYTINGKTLQIKLNVPLKEETTYSIHFNKAVKDTHEGTKATGQVLTFSTGSCIDPIMAKGKIKDLLTDKPIEDVNVYLYCAKRDTKEWQEQGAPDYYTTTDKDGNFQIEYIRLGKYYIRATTGKDNSYKIDYEKDKYGFLKDPIDLNDSREDIVVPLVTADVRELKLLRSTPQKGLFEIIFNKAIEQYQLVSLQTIGAKGKPEIYSLFEPKSPKNITIYNTFGLLEGDTFKVQLTVQDKFNQSLKEEIAVAFKEGKAETNKNNLTYNLSERPLPSVLPDFTESITFNKPIKLFKEDLIYFECKNEQKILLKADELKWNENKTKLTIRKHFAPEEVGQFVTQKQEHASKSNGSITKQLVTLQIEAGACTAFDQSTHKKIVQTYKLRNKEETGSITGNIKSEHVFFIVELLNDKDQIVDAIRNQKNYTFNMVPPGTYRIRVLVLNQGAEEWSPGNVLQNIEPNPVIFYEKEINITEKWHATGIDFQF